MSEVKQVRNKTLLPDLRKEGELSKDILLKTQNKHIGSTGSRLFSHHTLASVRRLSFYHPFHGSYTHRPCHWASRGAPGFAAQRIAKEMEAQKAVPPALCVAALSLPKDSLDLILTTTYNQSTEQFADKEDLYLQAETIGCETWRRLRNTFDKKPPTHIPLGHPMKRGGIKDRKSPFSVKLMNSGVHSSQTNPGYSRQPAGGAIFFY